MAARGHQAKEGTMKIFKGIGSGFQKGATGATNMASGARGMTKDLYLFQKSLRDMIKGIRACRDKEEEFINAEITRIHKEIRSPDPKTKCVALQKITYLHMSGHDMGWCSFHCIEVMSQSRFALKHTGYLAAQQSFLDNTDVLLLITNLLKKDLASTNAHEAGFALDCLANVMTPDLARDLVADIFSLLNRYAFCCLRIVKPTTPSESIWLRLRLNTFAG
jgi:AP-3 complex subunit delta-1